ncbi:MAG: type II secretion system protein [Planctomycetota bacterium]|jgi:prepilin-type N-terminal cleavage/methylation domain-containing protein|nr:type II secretion system protein [Planctomycetota bacterium]
MVTRRAFSLIELLVVMSIIAALASLLLVVINVLWDQSKEAKTRAIIALVHQAVGAQVAERATAFSTAEHPLTGTKPTRSAFVRAADGSAVATTGTAYVGIAPSDCSGTYASRATQVMLRDDIFADSAVPGLVGLPRASMRRLGARIREVTEFRWHPSGLTPGADPDASGKLVRPPEPSQANAAAKRLKGIAIHDQTVRQIINEGLREDFGQLGALGDKQHGVDGLVWARDYRILVDPTPLPRWQGNAMLVGSSDADVIAAGAAVGGWVRYWQPGITLLDAWGNELVIADVPGGRIGVISTGADGAFAVRPADDNNGTISTDARLTSFATGDADARTDNLVEMLGTGR